MYDHIFKTPAAGQQQIEDAIIWAKAARSDALGELLARVPDLFRDAYSKIRQSNQNTATTTERS